MEEGGKGCVVWKRGMEMPGGRLSERKLGWKMKEVPTEAPRLGKSWAGTGETWWGLCQNQNHCELGLSKIDSNSLGVQKPPPDRRVQSPAPLPPSPKPALFRDSPVPTAQDSPLVSSPVSGVPLGLEPVSEPSSHTGF